MSLRIPAASATAPTVYSAPPGKPEAASLDQAMRHFPQQQEEKADLWRKRVRGAVAAVLSQPHAAERLEAAARICDSGWKDAQRVALLELIRTIPAGQADAFAEAVGRINQRGLTADEDKLHFARNLAAVVPSQYGPVADAAILASSGQVVDTPLNSLVGGPSTQPVTWPAGLVTAVARVADAQTRAKLAELTCALSSDRTRNAERSATFSLLAEGKVLDKPAVMKLLQGSRKGRPSLTVKLALQAEASGLAAVWESHGLLRKVCDSQAPEALATALCALSATEVDALWPRAETLVKACTDQGRSTLSLQAALSLCRRLPAAQVEALIDINARSQTPELLSVMLQEGLTPAAATALVEALALMGYGTFPSCPRTVQVPLARLARQSAEAVRERARLAKALRLISPGFDLQEALVAVCELRADRLAEFQALASARGLATLAGDQLRNREVVALCKSLQSPFKPVVDLYKGIARAVGLG